MDDQREVDTQPRARIIVARPNTFVLLSEDKPLAQSEIDAIRALLGSKPRPVGWSERRQRIEEVGSVWPVADDIRLEAVDCDGVPGEWSLAPGSDPSRVLLYFHGGGRWSAFLPSPPPRLAQTAVAALVGTARPDSPPPPGRHSPAPPDQA